MGIRLHRRYGGRLHFNSTFHALEAAASALFRCDAVNWFLRPTIATPSNLKRNKGEVLAVLKKMIRSLSLCLSFFEMMIAIYRPL